MRSLRILSNIAKHENPNLLKAKAPALSLAEKEMVYRLFSSRDFAKPFGQHDQKEQAIFENVYDRLYWPGTDLLE